MHIRHEVLEAVIFVVPRAADEWDSRRRIRKRIEEELSDLLTAQVEVRVKKRVKRMGKMEEMGELSIQFGSLDELNGLIDKLRG